MTLRDYGLVMSLFAHTGMISNTQEPVMLTVIGNSLHNAVSEHVPCAECDQFREDLVKTEPDLVDEDYIPTHALPYPRSPSMDPGREPSNEPQWGVENDAPYMAPYMSLRYAEYLISQQPRDDLEPPSEQDSEDGEEAFQRLTRPTEEEEDNFIDYWIDHDSPPQIEKEEYHGDRDNISPPSSEDGEDAYRRLMDKGKA